MPFSPPHAFLSLPHSFLSLPPIRTLFRPCSLPLSLSHTVSPSRVCVCVRRGENRVCACDGGSAGRHGGGRSAVRLCALLRLWYGRYASSYALLHLRMLFVLFYACGMRGMDACMWSRRFASRGIQAEVCIYVFCLCSPCLWSGRYGCWYGCMCGCARRCMCKAPAASTCKAPHTPGSQSCMQHGCRVRKAVCSTGAQQSSMQHECAAHSVCAEHRALRRRVGY